MSPEEKKALAMFKTIELSNALQSLLNSGLSWKPQPTELNKVLTKQVRAAMRSRRFVVNKQQYELTSSPAKELFTIGARLYFLGKKDKKGAIWKRALQFSDFLVKELQEQILGCLLDVYFDKDLHANLYPQSLLQTVYRFVCEVP
jgi:hypothetical protein